MIEHMQRGDMPKLCESVKTWLSDRYGARLINAIFQNNGKKDNQNAERRSMSMKLRKTKTAFW